jgi:hypothetical protein
MYDRPTVRMRVPETATGAVPSWEHFAHEHVGVGGWGATPAEAFAQTALAMTAVVTTPGAIRLGSSVAITCEASSLDLLLHECLKAIAYEMATRGEVFGLTPGHPSLPQILRPSGQPALIGGSMVTQFLILAGTKTSEKRVFSSACTGGGHKMSRPKALKTRMGRQVVDELKALGVVVAVPPRGVTEEAPGAYKGVRAVVDAAEAAGLASKVARLSPVICIKG